MSLDIKIEEIANRMADAIISDNVFTKEKLIPKIVSILKIWINVKNQPVLGRRRKTNLEQMIQIQQKYKIEKDFWKNKVKNLTNRPMQSYYNELQEIVDNSGLSKELIKKAI